MPRMRENIAEMKPYVPGVLLPGLVKLASNENPLGPSPRVVEALAEAARSIHLYPDASWQETCAELALHHGLGTDQFIIGNGSDEILMLIAGTFLGPGDKCLVPSPGFSEYRYSARLFDAGVQAVPLKRGAFDLDAFLQALDGSVKVIFLCSPNNPTGTIIRAGELERFLARLPRDIVVVLDQAYAEFVDDPEYPDFRRLIEQHANLVVTRTFSKVYGLAGLRIGYCAAASSLIDQIKHARPPFSVNHLAQIASVAALRDREHFSHTLACNRAGRDFLENFLGSLHPQGIRFLRSQANFILVETRRDGQEMFSAIAERGVTIRATKGFGLPTCIRVSVGTQEHNELFTRAFTGALAVVPPIELEPYLD